MFSLKLHDIKEPGKYVVHEPKTGASYLCTFHEYDDPDEPAAFGQLYAYEGSKSSPQEEFKTYLFMPYSEYYHKNLCYKYP